VQASNIAAGAVGTAQMADFAITGEKLRLGTETGTDADGTITADTPGLFNFYATFDYPFTSPPTVSLLAPGWTLGAVTASGFSASHEFLPPVPLTLDSEGSVGQNTSLAVVNGFPAVSYYDATNDDLKFILLTEELRWQASDGTVTPLTAASVAAGAITSEQLAANAVQAANIASGTIGTTQLAANAVQSGNIASGAVGASQLASGVVDSTKLASNITISGSLTAGTITGNGSGLTHIPASAVVSAPPGMVLIPAGAFTMGDTVDGMPNATPIPVTLSAFYIAVDEVTLSQWQAVHLWATSHGYSFTHAGDGKSVNHPVYAVDWYDVVKWCNARSEMEGLTPCYYTDASQTTVYRTGSDDLENTWVNWSANGYRLPTEAEWEKAARGGLAGQRFPWGDTITQNLANYNSSGSPPAYDLGPAGYNALGNDGTTPYTTPVGTFAPNGYGLHDMAGNVAEWCWDWYDYTYTGGTDPRGPTSGSYRVCRGGCWSFIADNCRTARRDFYDPDNGYTNGKGFRPARSSVP